MSKKIIIFDLDGTLLNTLEDLTLSTNFVLNSFGFPQKTLNQIREYVGNGVKKLIQRAVPNGINSEDVEKCLELFKKYYCENIDKNTKPYEGIIDLLNDLKNQKYILSVVSNKYDKAVKQLCDKYFPHIIELACGEDEQKGVRKKPYPDMVSNILKHYNLKSQDAVFVGDSQVDIQTAKNSGIQCISVTWGFKDKSFLVNQGAEILADKPKDIIEILKNL